MNEISSLDRTFDESSFHMDPFIIMSHKPSTGRQGRPSRSHLCFGPTWLIHAACVEWYESSPGGGASAQIVKKTFIFLL